jgi:hypothetical protein
MTHSTDHPIVSGNAGSWANPVRLRSGGTPQPMANACPHAALQVGDPSLDNLDPIHDPAKPGVSQQLLTPGMEDTLNENEAHQVGENDDCDSGDEMPLGNQEQGIDFQRFGNGERHDEKNEDDRPRQRRNEDAEPLDQRQRRHPTDKWTVNRSRDFTDEDEGRDDDADREQWNLPDRTSGALKHLLGFQGWLRSTDCRRNPAMKLAAQLC